MFLFYGISGFLLFWNKADQTGSRNFLEAADRFAAAHLLQELTRFLMDYTAADNSSYIYITEKKPLCYKIKTS